jgi:hypothetical protein
LLNPKQPGGSGSGQSRYMGGFISLGCNIVVYRDRVLRGPEVICHEVESGYGGRRSSGVVQEGAGVNIVKATPAGMSNVKLRGPSIADKEEPMRRDKSIVVSKNGDMHSAGSRMRRPLTRISTTNICQTRELAFELSGPCASRCHGPGTCNVWYRNKTMQFSRERH